MFTATTSEVEAELPSSALERRSAERRRRMRLRHAAERFSVPLALLGAIVAFSIAMPDTFFTRATFNTVVGTQAIIFILALAVTIPLRTHHFDLSIASLAVLCSAVLSVLTVKHGVPLVPACGIALAVGAAAGLLNGLLVVVVGIDSFIATLGTSSLYLGITYWVTKTEVITGLPQGLLDFARHQLLGIPAIAWYGWLLALLLWLVFEFTPAGRYLLFVGGNPDAARLIGLRTRLISTCAYVASAVIVAFAGIGLTGVFGATDPSAPESFLLPTYAAAFLGAAAIQVGRFNVVGTVVGVYLLAVGSTGLQLLGAQAWVSQVFNGAALIVAVGFSRLIKKGER